MYVKVRTMDGSRTAVLTISKLTSVEEFRALISDKFDVASERQRLFFRGKQMEDGHTLFDYSVNINDVIQLMIKPVFHELTNKPTSKSHKDKSNLEHKEESSKEEPKSLKPVCKENSNYYKVGDLVDAKYLYDGSWWEAKITKIIFNSVSKKSTPEDDGLLYYVKYERYDDLPEDELKLEHIRPRARAIIPFQEVRIGSTLMVNYNIENPEERGYWFDCKVKKVIDTRKEKKLIGTLYVSDKSTLEECHIRIVDELFQIEKMEPLRSRVINALNERIDESHIRKSAAKCSSCKDNPKRKCKDCGCTECGGKENPDKQLMCDECDQPFHIYCLDPPLEQIPDVEEWFCHLCKNDDSEIVKAGEKLKESKKRSKMASAKNTSTRDWGKGFACAGRQKICSIVPQNHFGPVPGVEVGTLWKFRLQASEAGIHRPHVAGIHGRENEGAYSIVLSGGYEDDEDNGENFTYTGSGGRDLSGNKRTAEQSCDQQLTRMNKALALNCNTPLNKNGAEAKDWRKGKPVRVVRNCKGRKHSSYAPEEGNRYDGIYKIVKYWQAAGKSGFKVWRYLLRRDDPTPAPWTKEGAKRIKQMGLTMQYPDGYLEAMKEKEKSEGQNSEDEEEEKSVPKRGRKRKSLPSKEGVEATSPKPKKAKSSSYTLPKELLNLVKKDDINNKVWKECREAAAQGKAEFLKIVEEKFLCVCCQSLSVKPVSTPCHHNICLVCIQRSFKAKVYCCPSCRNDLGKDYPMTLNDPLQKILQFLYPGYDTSR